MATNTYKNAASNLTATTEFTVYTVPASTTAILRSIFCTNISVTADTQVSVYWYDNSQSNARYFLLCQSDIQRKGALETISNSFVLEPGDILACSSTTANFVNITASILEVS